MPSLLKMIEQKPRLKYVFTGGKGGVGKTISAAGIAYYYASQGYKTLIASLNPVSYTHLTLPTTERV